MSTAGTLTDRGTAAGHSDFGPLITKREASTVFKVFMLMLLGLLGLLSGTIAIGTLVLVAKAGWIVLVVGLPCLPISIFCFWGMVDLFRSISFYQGGAVETGIRRRREFAYADAVSLKYSLVRQYVNGIYTGTQLTLRMGMADGRKLKMSVRHKEKPQGMAITIFGKKFSGEDEMDVVRDVIASHVANRLTAQLAETGSVEWGKVMRITSEGIVPLHGKRKGQTVPWKEIAGVGAIKGWFHIGARGDKKSFVSTPCGGTNFYPCVQLLGTLMETSGPVAPEAVSEAAPAQGR